MSYYIYMNNNQNNLISNIIYTNTLNNNNQKIIYNTYQSDSIKGIVECNSVSDIFFSFQNIEAIQESIKYYVYKNIQQRISNQSEEELMIIMRSFLLQYGNLHTNDPISEVKRLNEKVIEFSVNKIINQISMYLKYRNDINKNYVPIDHPQYVNKNNFTYDMTNI